jgi:hypothetical protein
MRPRNKHGYDLCTNRDQCRSNANDAQNYRTTILAFDSKHNDKFKVVTFLDLIRLSHFESSLARAVRQSGEVRNTMPSALTVTADVLVSRL